MGMDSVSMWTWIFFVFLILIGSFVIVNLTLAIILSKFNEGRAEMIRENSKKAKKEKRLATVLFEEVIGLVSFGKKSR